MKFRIGVQGTNMIENHSFKAYKLMYYVIEAINIIEYFEEYLEELLA